MMSTTKKQIRVRIAPSPTGPLHIGTARTALFNWLFARKHNGKFILRIEDTDLERSDKKYEKDITESLKWLGVDWDEGIGVGGGYAPYRQSERTGTYTRYIEKLLEEKKAFYCFHTSQELEKEKQEQFKKKEAPRHVCDHFEKPPRKNKEQGIIRFRSPEKKVRFKDLIREDIEFDSTFLGDVSLAKSVSTPLYNFAVVIDDFEMDITHVIRGEDHISNTPKQILIQEALGFKGPEYAHLPLILGPDRSKLSKRHGALSVSWYRDKGYLPEAMINFMALLGWNPGDEREVFSLDELIKEFSLERIHKGGAVFNTEKLDWINGHYIRSMNLDELTEKCIPFLKKQTTDNRQLTTEYIKNVVALEQERMKKFSEIGELTDFFFKDKLEYDRGLLGWPPARLEQKEEETVVGGTKTNSLTKMNRPGGKNMNDEEISEILGNLENILSKIDAKDFTKENLQKILMIEAKRVGDTGKVFWPFRVALTGKKASPDPVDVAVVLRKEKVLKRIKDARQ